MAIVNTSTAKTMGAKTAGSALQTLSNQPKKEPFDLGTAYDNNQKMKYRQAGIDALKPVEPFKMDLASIQSDPTYQAAMESAKEATQVAEGNISSALNRRGVMDSTINSNAAANAAQAEYGRVNRELLPGLIEDQYKRYMDQAATNRQYASDMFGVSDMYENDNQTAFNNSITEAGLTGNFLSPEARSLINEVTQLGEAWKTGTPEQKAAYHQQANTARAKLAGLGVDPSLFGANVSTEGRLANVGKAGVQTLGGRSQANADASTKLNETQVMATLTGVLPNGQKTTSQQQQELENQWYLSDQTGVISPALAKLYGLPENTPTQAAKQWAEQQATDKWYKEESVAQGWDSSAQNWAGLDFDMQNAGGKSDSTFTPSQVYSSIEQRFPQFFKPDGFGEITKPTAADIESMYQSVIGYGLGETEENDILRSIGLTDKQIDDLDKKFLAPGN